MTHHHVIISGVVLLIGTARASEACPYTQPTSNFADNRGTESDDAVWDYHTLLQSRVSEDRQEQKAKRQPAAGSLAICISGGLRGAQSCAPSLVSSLIKPNLDHLQKVDVFIATWTDRQCSNRPHEENIGLLKVTEDEVRRLYTEAGAKVAGVWVGDPQGQGIPEKFKETWPSHSAVEYPYGSMNMLDGTHHMAKLWKHCLDLIPDDYEVIVHARPDQHFPPHYQWFFQKNTSASWEVNIVRGDTVQADWATTLQDNTVYMSLNKYHMNGNPGTVPDDRLGFGLAHPMRGVFATMDTRADQGAYDESSSEYRQIWGRPEKDNPQDSTMRHTRLNPRHSWVRERYPEKLLGHHIIRQGFSYYLISNPEISSYDIVGLVKEC